MVREALVYAVGVALSPVAIAATLLLLTCRRAVANAFSFLIGWTLGVALAIFVLVVLVNSTGLTGSDPLRMAVAELVIGLGFLVAALAVWRQRHRSSIDTPPWVAAVDSFTTVRSAGLGVVLSGANPKVVALSLGAALSLAQAEANAAVTSEAIVLYCAIGTLGVLTPLSVYLALPGHAPSWLGRLRVFLSRYETAILVVVGLLIGATFVTDGLDSL